MVTRCVGIVEQLKTQTSCPDLRDIAARVYIFSLFILQFYITKDEVGWVIKQVNGCSSRKITHTIRKTRGIRQKTYMISRV